MMMTQVPRRTSSVSCTRNETFPSHPSNRDVPEMAELPEQDDSSLVKRNRESRRKTHSSHIYNASHDTSQHPQLRGPDSNLTSRSFYYAHSRSSTVTAPSHRKFALSTPNIDFKTSSPTSDQPSFNDSTANNECKPAAQQKRRPTMIDLSKLFPKHRELPAPLLSPNRMTSSPSHSPVSLHSDPSPHKAQKFSENKLPKLGRPISMRRQYEDLFPALKLSRRYEARDDSRKQEPRPFNRKYEGVRSPNLNRKKAPSEWFDGPEGQISDDDIFEEEENDEEKQVNFEEVHSPRSIKSRMGVLPSRCSSQSIGLPFGSPKRRTPNTPDFHFPAISAPSATRSLSQDTDNISTLDKKFARTSIDKVLKKNGRTAMDNSNLNESSVLCLSSSEDESDNEGDPSNPMHSPGLRDSTDIYGTNIEICTAKAIAATKPPAIKSVLFNAKDKQKDTNSVQSHEFDRATTSSRWSRSTGPKGILSFYDDDIPPVPKRIALSDQSSRQYSEPPPSPAQSSVSDDRRSRIMAVTQQEQHLLEMIRKKKVDVPPNLPHLPKPSNGMDKNKKRQTPQLRIQSQGIERSFLELSPLSPAMTSPPLNFPSQDSKAVNKGKEGTLPQSAIFDGGDQGLTNSPISQRRLSQINSDYLPSPSTARTSPDTHMHLCKLHLCSGESSPRTLPMMPTSPDEKAQSISRADGSNAIILDNVGNDLDIEQDLPLWAINWGNGHTNWKPSIDFRVVNG